MEKGRKDGKERKKKKIKEFCSERSLLFCFATFDS